MPELKIAFLGDIVGKPGRRVVEQQLPRLRQEHSPDIIIANAENARSGSGLSPSIYKKIREAGIHAITLGDHVFRDQKIIDYLQSPSEPIARPANLSSASPGKRMTRLESEDKSSWKILIVTVLGRVFFPFPANDPFECMDTILDELGDPGTIVIVEAHMEATSEKIALAHHLEGRVAAVFGTHTHVPTADARILAGGTAFITDAGMCGPYDSIIGRDTNAVLKHMITGLHSPYSVATSGIKLCGVVVRINTSTGRAISIERIEYDAELDKPPFIEP